MQLLSSETPAIKTQESPPVPENREMPKCEEMKEQEREPDLLEKQRAQIEAQSAEILRLRASREKYLEGYKGTKARVAKLETDIEDITETHKEAWKKWEQRIQTVEVELTQANDLLATRSKEFSGMQSFFSTTDRLSEAEVLGIVRDLNENIFQVAAKLTEEWGEYRRSPSSDRKRVPNDNIEPFSQTYGPTLVHRVRDREPAAVTFLIQSFLCDVVVQLASSWQHNKELSVLGTIYQRLYATEGQAISARWRSLTHAHLAEPPSHADPISQHISGILWITGLFTTKEASLDFVKARVYSDIETIDRLAVRLESAFMGEITSCDMCLVYEAPCATFDAARMTREFKSHGSSTPRGQDKVAGTTEVGVEKRVGSRGEAHRTQVLLKTKVVLERDLEDL